MSVGADMSAGAGTSVAGAGGSDAGSPVSAMNCEASSRSCARARRASAVGGMVPELTSATGLSAAAIAAALAELELNGLASEGDGVYRACQ